MNPNKRVHFIDDDPTAGDLFRRFSRDKSYNVEIFRDPVKALEAIRTRGSDLVVTDLSMPGLSGLDLLQAIRQANIELPVIMITGFSTEDNAIRALRLGAADFIKKPFDMDGLLALIDRKLNTAQQREMEIRTSLPQTRLLSPRSHGHQFRRHLRSLFPLSPNSPGRSHHRLS